MELQSIELPLYQGFCLVNCRLVDAQAPRLGAATLGLRNTTAGQLQPHLIPSARCSQVDQLMHNVVSVHCPEPPGCWDSLGSQASLRSRGS